MPGLPDNPLLAWKSLITLNCALLINGVRGSLKQQNPR